ncbi:hypothetical protein E2C01_066555 [Portunus trituberculatus]|uniref:Uncharacterized protein n=1 Tax=Portunus trituberculatus TaxID=210409 RepID=A0A5B7HSM4_PORTR|nr:hypothetical protein [Portunus trituberculatus]
MPPPPSRSLHHRLSEDVWQPPVCCLHPLHAPSPFSSSSFSCFFCFNSGLLSRTSGGAGQLLGPARGPAGPALDSCRPPDAPRRAHTHTSTFHYAALCVSAPGASVPGGRLRAGIRVGGGASGRHVVRAARSLAGGRRLGLKMTVPRPRPRPAPSSSPLLASLSCKVKMRKSSKSVH